MKRMKARYRGTCGKCRGSVVPGQMIDYAGRGRVIHTACPDGNGPDGYTEINPATGQRMSDNARVHVATFSSGHSVTRNVNGRCIDAPCCGCCTY